MVAVAVTVGVVTVAGTVAGIFPGGDTVDGVGGSGVASILPTDKGSSSAQTLYVQHDP